MASPSVALRFRDTTTGVDTIAEHKAIIDRYGNVWWGWWKKTFEDDHASDLGELNFPLNVLILDRSTKRMFSAIATSWQLGAPSETDLLKVPSYYRSEAREVFGWFLLERIHTASYDETVASKFGDHTLVFIRPDEDDHESKAALEQATRDKVAPTASRSGRSCILHLSDLHFGPHYDFLVQGERAKIGDPRRTLTHCLTEDLKRIGAQDDIAAVVVTGDFITAGNWRDDVRNQVLAEFDALRSALKLERDQIIAVPGNHDIERYPKDSNIDPAVLAVKLQTSYKHEREYRTFVDELVGRNWKESLNYVRRLEFASADLIICVLNSCTILATEWTEYGYVGDSGLGALAEMSQEPIGRPTYKMMALHHHLLPVADIAAPNSKGVTLSLDAPVLLDAAQKAGVQMALHGHEHMPRLARYQTIPLAGAPLLPPLLVVSNGSAGVSQDRRPGSERNTYCLFNLEEKGAHLWMRELRPDCKAGAGLFEGGLGIGPLQS